MRWKIFGKKLSIARILHKITRISWEKVLSIPWVQAYNKIAMIEIRVDLEDNYE